MRHFASCGSSAAQNFPGKSALISAHAWPILYKMKELRIPVAEARKNLASILGKAAKKNQRVKITRYNRTLVGIISRADLLRLKDCEHMMKAPAGKRRKNRNRKRG